MRITQKVMIDDAMVQIAHLQAKKLNTSVEAALGIEIFRNYLIKLPELKHIYYEDRFPSYPGKFGFVAKFEDRDEVRITTATYKSVHCNKVMIQEKNFDSSFWDYYIGIKIVDGYGEIWGYAKPDDFQLKINGFDETEQATYWVEFKSLRSISELISKMATRKKEGVV